MQSHLGASGYRRYLHDIKPTLGVHDFSSSTGTGNGTGSDSSPAPAVVAPVIAGIGRKKAALTGKRVSHGLAGEHGKVGPGGEPRKKRSKRSSGKACVYCRRSHMVCEGGRPCERCIKREIPHLCRDFTPPPHHSHSSHKSEPTTHTESPTQSQPQAQQQQQQQQSQLPNIYQDPNFPPTWPLLPDTSGQLSIPTLDPTTSFNGDGNGTASWGSNDDGELAALNKFMKDLGVPALPGDFFSFMDGLDSNNATNNNNNLTVPFVDDLSSIASGTPADLLNTSSQGQSSFNKTFAAPAINLKGKGKVVPMSRIDKFMMAAADQPNGTRAARLAQVIKAKYDAGLLKPYDYVKGYERMNKWMDSGRAAPKQESRANSETPSSPARCAVGLSRNGRSSLHPSTPIQALGKSISPESRRRILAALAGFRPKFRQIAQTLTNVDLVFVEEAMERWMLEYDRAFASIHTPSCIWRRTGEIQKANQEFSNLTGIPASMFRDGQLCVYELMDEDSAVRYWEGYAKIAFDQNQRSMSISCTLHIPSSLARHRPRHLSATPSSHIAKSAYPAPPATPDPSLPSQVLYNDGASDYNNGGEEFRELKCCFSATIRRDAWGVPVAIMGQWIVSRDFTRSG
ncbi:transcriptional regulatory protein [Kwoniella heveanensis BCC8398]|uniref:Transcriptional regulatory protein n=1 Tax=Kwoniella heveanensis BCC8398 TaxID=1296120 RepID=A0A1B9GZL8_9TREE|nr:transcriptional regulatory protein [Kwoniella heveanensis BCC8398]